MNEAASAPRARRVKLQHILFLLLLLPGVIPLVLSSFYLLKSNREALQVKEKELLTLSAQGFAQLLSDDLAERAAQLRQVGRGLVAAPGFEDLEQRLRQDWAQSYFERFLGQERRDLRAFRFVNQKGQGLSSDLTKLEPAVVEAMNQAFQEAVGGDQTAYRFALIHEGEVATPAVAMAVPVATPDNEDQLILEALAPLAMRRAAGKGLDLDEIFLIDAGGARLWSPGTRPRIEEALLASDLVQRFASLPVNVTSEISLEVDGQKQSTLAQVVPVRETGWGVVAHKTTQAAFQQVQVLVLRILMFSTLAALLALVIALFASRAFSLPIQRLAETTHQIAAGHFDRRVSTEGLSFEVAELAEDFNRMSDTVESYIERLQKAAEVNRQLFISSIRAFAAAIDAKDPYTRGHSERVARYSRAIARYLGLPKDMQEKVWISAVLHDVGKIGVEDHVLKKHGVLTDEEFEQMKLHPVIGADIVEPISALREHLPGIRWHHEAWNGSGYPDGLKGEQIPLMARIIGVADTFDAITTNRPYQTASSPEFAIQTVKKLTGTRFDARIVTSFLLAWDAGQIEMDPPSPATPVKGAVPPSAESLSSAPPSATAEKPPEASPRGTVLPEAPAGQADHPQPAQPTRPESSPRTAPAAASPRRAPGVVSSQPELRPSMTLPSPATSSELAESSAKPPGPAKPRGPMKPPAAAKPATTSQPVAASQPTVGSLPSAMPEESAELPELLPSLPPDFSSSTAVPQLEVRQPTVPRIQSRPAGVSPDPSSTAPAADLKPDPLAPGAAPKLR